MSKQRDELIPTRASLIIRLKNWQDQSSWQEFFDTYWKLIYGIARKANLTDAEAQDVVQEVMISVAKHMPNFQYNSSGGSFKAWLLKMTGWRIVDQIRRRAPQTERPPSSTQTASATEPLEKVADPAIPSFDEIWEVEWQKNLVDAAVAKVKRRLDPEKFQIFDLYVNKEWPAEKVASKFNISAEQVHTTKFRVTAKIKEEVARLENGIT